MEKFNENKRTIRSIAIAGALGLGVLIASGCGQTTPPTGEQVKDDMKYFDLKDVKAADGGPVHCVMYGSQSEGTNVSKSWFGFACDFDGGAQFPSEVSTTTTTTKPR